MFASSGRSLHYYGPFVIAESVRLGCYQRGQRIRSLQGNISTSRGVLGSKTQGRTP